MSRTKHITIQQFLLCLVLLFAANLYASTELGAQDLASKSYLAELLDTIDLGCTIDSEPDDLSALAQQRSLFLATTFLQIRRIAPATPYQRPKLGGHPIRAPPSFVSKPL